MTQSEIGGNRKAIHLSILEESPAFRSDFLYFIRLAGTFAQTIFWQAFSPSAMARRKKMLKLADETIPGGRNKDSPFRRAILDPRERHAKATDLLHKGFIELLKKLGEDPAIRAGFSAGLKREHAIPWNFDEFVEYLDALREKRGYLEHFEERAANGRVFEPAMNLRAIEALGILLLPELCNMLLMSARAVKGEDARRAEDEIRAVLEDAKRTKAESVRSMHSEERRRNRMSKTRRQALSPDAPNAPLWRKSYRLLALLPTEYRPYQFKRRYDFIGPQNLRLLFAKLGSPLKPSSRALAYSSEEQRVSFRYDVEALYRLSVLIGAAIHRFVGVGKAETGNKGKRAKGQDNDSLSIIRNTLAHNGLFWCIREKGERPLEVEAVFSAVMAPLAMSLRSEFCVRIENLLRKENYAVLHSESDGHPKAERLRRWTEEKRRAVRSGADGTKLEPRRGVRKIAAEWMRALQAAGQANGLRNARKNVM